MGRFGLSSPLGDQEKAEIMTGWGEVPVIVYEGINAVFTAYGVYSLCFHLLKRLILMRGNCQYSKQCFPLN